jgi:hypothetical protein
MLLEQFSPQQSPSIMTSHAPTTNQTDRPRRPVPRKSYDFRRVSGLKVHYRSLCLKHAL